MFLLEKQIHHIDHKEKANGKNYGLKIYDEEDCGVKNVIDRNLFKMTQIFNNAHLSLCPNFGLYNFFNFKCAR